MKKQGLTDDDDLQLSSKTASGGGYLWGTSSFLGGELSLQRDNNVVKEEEEEEDGCSHCWRDDDKIWPKDFGLFFLAPRARSFSEEVSVSAAASFLPLKKSQIGAFQDEEEAKGGLTQPAMGGHIKSDINRVSIIIEPHTSGTVQFKLGL